MVRPLIEASRHEGAISLAETIDTTRISSRTSLTRLELIARFF